MNIKADLSIQKKKNKEGGSVQAVERALSLLKFIGESPVPVSISEIAKRTEINRTTVWRLVGTLESEGFIEKDFDSKGYRLGYAIFQLTGKNDQYGPLIWRSRQILEEIKEESGETVLLSVPNSKGILTIDQVNTDHNIRLIDYSNTLAPFHCTSNGKIFLSLLSEKELNTFLQTPLTCYSHNTITDPEELKQELCRIQEEKIGLCIGELDENENAISAPIFDEDGNIKAFITIGGPSFRFTKDMLLSWRDRLLQAAKKIEQKLR